MASFVLAKANVSVVVAYVKKVSPETIALVQPIKNHAKKTEYDKIINKILYPS